MPSRDDPAEPKQWEVRAALRAFTRSDDSAGRRNPARELVKAGWQLVAEHDDFTLRTVAVRADVALQTFYRHFGSKDEFVLAMIEEGIAHGAADAASGAKRLGDPVERLKSVVLAPMTTPMSKVHRRRLAWHAREQERLSRTFPREVDAVHEPYRAVIRSALSDAIGAGCIVAGDVELLAVLIQKFVVAMTYWLASTGSDSAQDTAEQLWQLCWNGMLVRVERVPGERVPGEDSNAR